ncbi:MAG TPA: hypothetical protein VH063_11680 [Gaiellaceae bacterium]|jgi:hypothetical protein|nr:hypothetical protein [Gaiellaceae bacterium]
MIAAHFLAGSLLTLFIPIALLVGVIVWWSIAARRASRRKAE